MTLCLIKVGGSLLDLADLGSRIEAVCQQRLHSQLVLFPGGGATADLVRDWHQRFQLSEDDSHFLAIDSLRLNAALLRRLGADSRLIENRNELARMPAGTIGVLDPQAELQRLEDKFPDDAPPHHWDVTSDSLAAWIARCWQVDELILMKSAGCPTGQTVTAAMQSGLVDPYFPGIAGYLPRVNWCAARESDLTIQSWLTDGQPVAR